MAEMQSGGWRRRIYRFALFATAQFVVLTLLGMVAYPGGTLRDPALPRYSFLQNFFSDLGLLTAHNGADNGVSAALFIVALTTGGLALLLYFLSAPVLFRAQRWAFRLALAGSLFGVLTGVGFVGVAWTPADVLVGPHVRFVLLAFRSLPLVALLYGAAILLTPGYPNRYAAAFGVFGLLLIAYLWLLTAGPDTTTPAGLVIQAAGQKVIVYAAIVSMGYQCLGALRLTRPAR